MYKKRLEIELGGNICLYFKHKKGQVTLFIILGIVLLLALILIVALKTEVVKFKPGEIIPTEKGKVENYITACLDKIGNDALFRIGLQAGYIEVPEEISSDGNKHLRLSPMNVVPYWAYGTNTQIPSLTEIKQEIDLYIQQNLRTCLFNLQPFQETYDLTEKSSITSDTKLLDSKVQFNVHWNIEVRNKAGEVISEIIDHQMDSPIRFKKTYDEARRVVEKEMEVLKFEDITQDLIALEHPDVPVAGMDINCRTKEWDAGKVKETIQNLLHVNIPQLKVKGTDFVEFPPELTYYQNHYIWDIGEDYADSKIGITFNYDQNYPFYFDVTPLSGNKMKSSQLGGSKYLPFICVQTWKFTYDIIFPVLVQVRDERSNFVFNTAFTVHLNRNEPNRESAKANPSYFFKTITDEDYCKRKNIPLTVNTYEKVENDLTGVSYRDPLEDVDISFTCLRYKCELGQTEYGFAQKGDIAGITTNFPYCVGGILRGEKEGYKENWERVVTKAGDQVDLDLIPLFSFPIKNIKVLKHQFGELENIGYGKSLSKDEVALIKITSINKIKESEEPLHEAIFTISNILEEKTIEDQTVDLLAKADFTYNVEINILNEEKITGGYKGNWTISWDKLKKARGITFHTLGKDASSDEEMYEFVLGIDENSKLVPPPEIN